MNRTATSEHNGYSGALDAELGYKISLNKEGSNAIHKMYLRPFIGAMGSYISNEGYEEKGAQDLNLKIEDYSAFSAQARAGLGINGKVKKFGWYAKMGVRQLLTAEYNEIETSLLNLGDVTKMKIRSAENAQTTISGGIGADYEISENWTIFANGLGNFADVSTNYYANVGLTYKFGCKNNKKPVENIDEKTAKLEEMLTEKTKIEEELNEQLAQKEKELQNLRDKEGKELSDVERALLNDAETKEELNEQLTQKEKELQALKGGRELSDVEKALLNYVETKEKEMQNKVQNYENNDTSEQQKKSVRLTASPTFEFGTSELSDEGKDDLEKVAQEIQNHPEAEIVLEGHTDSVGSENVNKRLSEERAFSMATSLKKNYKVQNPISVVGKGADEPVETNDTEEGRAKNRRVDVILKNDK